MKTSATKRGATILVATGLAITAVPALQSGAQAAPRLTLVATSAVGTAFDLDEYEDGAITVQVADSAGAPVDVDDAQDLTYFWRITPFDTTAPAVRVPDSGRDLQDVETDGEFVVPLPAGQPSGTYRLVGALGPNAAGRKEIPKSVLLEVVAGQASVAMRDSDPLWATAGTDRKLKGSLLLENGTALPGRTVDLVLDRGARGSDPQADGGFAPVPPDTDPVLTQQAVTNGKGKFRVVLTDPLEEPQGTELGGKVTAQTAAAPGGTRHPDTASSLSVDWVSTEPPVGSTVAVDDLGAGTPGTALASAVTVLGPDDSFDVDPATDGLQGDADSDPDPVVGQLVTLTTDHGFFTETEPQPTVPGEPVGNLVDLGTTLEAVTDDQGKVEIALGIGRDSGFDDDGRVTATVAAAAGTVTGSEDAEWDTANPMNGKVEISLSRKREQVGPVDPALAGHRTYFEVYAQDQFGNPVDGQPIVLDYDGDLDDWDYSDDSVVSDLDDHGDIWVVSYETASIDITGTWLGAPTLVYTDTSGSTAAGTADVTGSALSEFYELDFDASTFDLASSAFDVAGVGEPVTETVTVRDQIGNPVRGYQVRFFRLGPDGRKSEARATRSTNARGQASYTFVGTRKGTARIVAEISDGVDSRRLSQVVRFNTAIGAALEGRGGGAQDRLRVSAARIAAGAKVVLLRVDGKREKTVKKGRLDSRGIADFRVRDRNGRVETGYVALVYSTKRSASGRTEVASVR